MISASLIEGIFGQDLDYATSFLCYSIFQSIATYLCFNLCFAVSLNNFAFFNRFSLPQYLLMSFYAHLRCSHQDVSWDHFLISHSCLCSTCHWSWHPSSIDSLSCSACSWSACDHVALDLVALSPSQSTAWTSSWAWLDTSLSALWPTGWSCCAWESFSRGRWSPNCTTE